MHATPAPTTAAARDIPAMPWDKSARLKSEQQQSRIVDICRTAHRNGRPDITRREIQERYEALHARLDANEVSGRVKKLIDKKVLEQVEKKRLCRVTGNEVTAVRVKPQQASLLAV